MKKLKVIYKWILISVILQTVVLSWLNYIYLPNRGQFRTTMYEMEFRTVRDRSYKLPEGAVDISVSFDGLYASFVHDGKIVIADLDSGREIKRLGSAGGEFTYHRWLPDREMLIYAIKEPEGKSGRVRISTYDVVPDIDRSYPDIKGLPEGSSVIDIELSPMTNIVYPMIKTSDTRARVYRFDIMDNLSLVFKTDLTTVIKETLYTDNLVYQLIGERICVRDGQTGKVTYLPVKDAGLLLDIDGRDVVYTGFADKSGRIPEIRCGRLGAKAVEWDSIRLPRAVMAEDIIITADGTVYVADRQTRIVECVKRGDGADPHQGETAPHDREHDLHQDGTVPHHYGSDSYQSETAPHDREHDLHQDGTVPHHYGSDSYQSETPPHDREHDLHQDETVPHHYRPVEYRGQLITMLDQYIVFLDGGELILRTLGK